MCPRIRNQQSEPRILSHRQKEVIEQLKTGNVTRIRYDQKWPADELVRFALKEGFLQEGLRSFPDPRKSWEVPMDIILLAHVMQRLNDQHSLLLAPYMVDSPEILTHLGYNAEVLETGFNDKAQFPREAPFHGETMKHILANSRAGKMILWFNEKWGPLCQRYAPGRTRQYVIDGCDIPIPEKHVRFYKGAGVRKNPDDTYSYGYKAVWIYEIIDKKGVIVALDIVPIQVHDIEAGRPLVARTNLEEGSCLIMDRGFIDSGWIDHLKKDRKIDVILPLRSNMQATQGAVAWADNQNQWQPHPNEKRAEKGQLVAQVVPPDLLWEECPELKSGALVRWKNKATGENEEVLFVTTREALSAARILEAYDQCPEIEEAHKQMKLFQGIERLPSKKIAHVVFRILMGVVGYNLMNLFLNSEHCNTYESFSLKTLRQKRKNEKNPDLVIYTQDAFAIMKVLEFMSLTLRLPEDARERLAQTLEQDGSQQTLAA